MKKEDVKPGLFISWNADRYFRAWNTYGKILEVNDNEVRLVTFDDFKPTTIDLDGSSIEKEISIVNKQDVEDYIEARKIRLNTRKAEIELEHKKAIREVETSIEHLNNYTL